MAKKKTASVTDKNESESELNKIVGELVDEDLTIEDLTDEQKEQIPTWYSSKSFLLDSYITNCFQNKEGKYLGGFAGGFVYTIAGIQGSGKTALALHIARDCQEQGGVVVYYDAENRLNLPFAQKLGVSIEKNKFIYIRNNTIEDFFEFVKKLVEKIKTSKSQKNIKVSIILDSAASLTTIKELKEDMGDGSFGYVAKQMSHGLRVIIKSLRDTNIALIILNQLRFNMNKRNPYEDDYIEPCGAALPYYASLQLRLLKPAKSDKIFNSKNQQIGTRVKVRFLKSSFGTPPPDLSFVLYYDRGIDDDVNMYLWLKERKLLTERKDKISFTIPTISKEPIKLEKKEWKKYLNEDNNREKLKEFIVDSIKIIFKDEYDDSFDLNEEEDYSDIILPEKSEEEANDDILSDLV